MGQTEAPLIVKPYVATHDALGAAGADGRRHGPHLRRRDGGLHRHGRRPRRHPGHQRHGRARARSTCRSSCCRRPSKPADARHASRWPSSAVTSTSSTRPRRARPTGMRLALNVAAMLIAFLAFIALFNFVLGLISPGAVAGVGCSRVAVRAGGLPPGRRRRRTCRRWPTCSAPNWWPTSSWRSPR